MTETSVTVLVVNWNGRDLLPSCLNSALSQDYDGELEIVVVDNGSTDGSLELLQEEFSKVTVLRNEENNYAAANNLGVRAAHTDFVLLLNSDATLEPGCISTLVEALHRDPSAAGAAPKVLYPDGRVYTTGILETPDLYWFDRDQGKPDDGRQQTEEVFGISGCCALFRRNAWILVGGQDDSFHMYYEDVEFCLRLRRAGYRLRYVPAARTTHIGHASIDKSPVRREDIGDRNRLLILATHYPDRFHDLAVASNWFRNAPREETTELLPMLAERLGVPESEMSLELIRSMRERCANGYRRWSLRRRLRKIWFGLKRQPSHGHNSGVSG